jgi:hypothetical protein
LGRIIEKIVMDNGYVVNKFDSDFIELHCYFDLWMGDDVDLIEFAYDYLYIMYMLRKKGYRDYKYTAAKMLDSFNELSCVIDYWVLNKILFNLYTLGIINHKDGFFSHNSNKPELNSDPDGYDEAYPLFPFAPEFNPLKAKTQQTYGYSLYC